MRDLKAFVAGMIFPAFFTPFIIGFYIYQGWGHALASIPTIYFGPILWGLWNVIFVRTRKMLPIPDRTFAISLYGGAYGLLSALINGLFFEFTSIVSSWPDFLIVVMVVGYPIFLYYVWRHVVNSINVLFEVY